MKMTGPADSVSHGGENTHGNGRAGSRSAGLDEEVRPVPGHGPADALRWARVKRIDEVLELARCSGFKDLFVESLSHGMRQRVALARTLLHDPVALILDEPANGLDPPARIEMRQLLLDLAQRGKTLIVTSHILPELARICNRVAIIVRRRLRA